MMRGGSSGLSGDAPMVTFTPEEAARNAMASSPAVGAILYPEWADDLDRQEGVSWMAEAAHERLATAMRSGERVGPLNDTLNSYLLNLSAQRLPPGGVRMGR